MSASGTEHSAVAKPDREHGHVLAALDMSEVAPNEGYDFAMQMPVTRAVANNRGGLQGGLLTTLVDVAAGICAIQDLPSGQTAATSDINIHFLSAVTEGPAHADVSILRRGKNKMVLRVDVRDVGRDVLSAVATASFTLVQLREGQLDHREAPRPSDRI